MTKRIIDAIKARLQLDDGDVVQMFNNLGCVNAKKEVIFDEDGVKVLYAVNRDYVEVLGLSQEDYITVYAAIGW